VITPVHVVGGGFAGAAAAVGLADAGLPVVLWEAGPTPGGRARGFFDPDSGETLDNGPHLFAGCYRRTRSLLARLGTADGLAFQERLRVPMRVDGADRGLVCPPLPGPAALVLGLMGLGPLSFRERLRLLRAGHALRRPQARSQAPDGTVAEWLAGLGMPPAAGRLLWDPLCRAVMNLPPEEADAAVFARALKMALLGDRGEARLGWARNGLGALLGNALGKHLAARGGEVRRDRVTGLTLEAAGGRVTGVVASGGPVAAQRVVLAVDAFAARALLPADGRLTSLAAALGAMRPAPIVSTYLWLDRPVVPLPRDTPFVGLVQDASAGAGAAEWVFDRDRMAGGAGHHIGDGGQRLATVASCADALAELPADRVVERVRRDLAGAFPKLARARVARARVVKERRATVRITPGLVRPAPGAVPGVPGLFLCGDYTGTGLPATVEGAVVSGEAAARAVLAPQGVSP
jgi:squalene-associated FAD-dependent desaturase